MWTAITAAVMFALAYGKRRTGRALANPVLTAEGRVTVIDALLAVAVLLGLALNAAAGWWWADPAAGLVIVYYALVEARTIRPDCTSRLPSWTDAQDQRSTRSRRVHPLADERRRRRRTSPSHSRLAWSAAGLAATVWSS